MSVAVIDGIVNVTLSDGNGGIKYLYGRRTLEAGVPHYLLIHLNYTTGYFHGCYTLVQLSLLTGTNYLLTISWRTPVVCLQVTSH